ncbi:unnamed protein product [Arabidopsis thaliana]|uniref:Uncharacterized protein n=1 Tax=Arabidopsis thaliana TaxID=3702 RepID=A0A654EGF6_ARATH|nr:unnamed protein product [Arabidopsis thaliana]VYS48423.1 unnamed protein product [Arabidopsis thaliana]
MSDLTSFGALLLVSAKILHEPPCLYEAISSPNSNPGDSYKHLDSSSSVISSGSGCGGVGAFQGRLFIPSRSLKYFFWDSIITSPERYLSQYVDSTLYTS